jgi:hypothetical protein
MPRIEIRVGCRVLPRPQNPHKSAGWDGEGNPTVDVCAECAKQFKLDHSVPEYLMPYLGFDAVVVTTDCEHPPYGTVDYDCDCCGMSLLPPEDD